MTATQPENMLVASQEFRISSLALGQDTTGFNHGQIPLMQPSGLFLEMPHTTNGEW